MTNRLIRAFFLAATAATIGACNVGEATETENLPAADACAVIARASLGLPQTTITIAEEVTAPFTPPETFDSRGFTVEDASFCRVAGVASGREKQLGPMMLRVPRLRTMEAGTEHETRTVA
mgnify:CR=1 FL=1